MKENYELNSVFVWQFHQTVLDVEDDGENPSSCCRSDLTRHLHLIFLWTFDVAVLPIENLLCH